MACAEIYQYLVGNADCMCRRNSPPSDGIMTALRIRHAGVRVHAVFNRPNSEAKIWFDMYLPLVRMNSSRFGSCRMAPSPCAALSIEQSSARSQARPYDLAELTACWAV